MIKKRFKSFFPVILFFIVLNGFFAGGRNMLQRWNADQDVLIIGNALLFMITLISFLILLKGLNNPNPQAFIRAVMGSFMIKFFICAVAAFIYISTYKKELNKPALFACMGLFLLYLFMEVGVFMKLLKQEKNG